MGSEAAEGVHGAGGRTLIAYQALVEALVR